MHKKLLLVLLPLLLLPALSFAQTGKVSGKVTDLETGEPLIGANVIVNAGGTTRGAATDANGGYVVLNVPIGKVTITASYIGYKAITIENVLVRSNETTDKDVQLPSDAYKVDEVVIVAEKPLVDKNVTNAKSTVTQEDIENLPVRGVESISALQAGVVSSGSSLYVRGSRADGTGFVVNGMPVNNPLYGGRSLTVIDNAIAEQSLQAGGYSAEFGGANGGLVATTTRTGGRKLRVEFETYTDNYPWADYGERTLGTYKTGFSTYILTAGGPLYGPVKFFVAGQNSFRRTPSSGWREDYDLTTKYDPLLRETDAHQLLTPEEQAKTGIFDPRLGSAAQKVDYRFPGGYFLNAASNSWTGNANLTFDLNPINIRVDGSYAYGTSRDGAGLTTKLAEKRAGLNESENYSVNAKFTHLLSPSTFYELYLGYMGSFGIAMDPDLEHNIFGYGDSVANAQFGYHFLSDGIPEQPVTMMGASFVPAGYPLGASYGKERFNSIQGKINFVHQIGRTHEIKTGGEFTRYSIRSFGIDAFGLASFMRGNPDANALEIAGSSGTNNYGYDYYGSELNDGENGPKEPVFAAFYALDKIELEDLVINVGLRYDYIDTNSKEFVNPNNIKFTSEGLIDQSDENLKDVSASKTISPRLGFSFPVTDRTVFYAQYGVFVQQSRLRNIYLGNATMSSQIKGGYAVSSPVGFGLKPEKTIQYDFGFRQQLTDNLAFDITAFYKDIRDQIQQRMMPAEFGAEHPAYYAWVNGDFATTTGASLSIVMRRTARIQVQANYTYSDARGTGSSPSSSFRALWLSPTETPFLPKYPMTLDFDQTHRGSINLDYRFGNDDGPELFGAKILERFGANILFQFNSGSPYTRVNEFSFGDRRTPIEAINSSRTPWYFMVDGRFDKTVEIASLDVNFYIWVTNLLNIKNVTGVYATSGSAESNNFLATDEGQTQIANYARYGEIFAQLYQDFYYQQVLMNAGVYSPPRRIIFGMRVNF
ncbi:MAG: TonB-dependent receptor [Bacteroidota bacterium]|jgi:outer membrane receptor protein involved in Fe transport|nr:TonB-dependent receptor [Bacteroidota bacterium]